MRLEEKKMNNIKLNSIKRQDDFLIFEDDSSKIVMSTAEKNKSFNRHTDEGILELENLKKDFNAQSVLYLRQVHSDKVFIYDGQAETDFRENEGDAIITDCKNVIIGVFTADCVPIILIDREKNVCAAIHSGWKGTFNSITEKTINKLKEEYGTDPKDLKAYIGAHIRKCCYEVSEELKEKFLEEKDILEEDLFKGRHLNMEECIIKDLRKAGLMEKNINSISLCTHCSEDIKLHSYRKSKGLYGRLFSFIILK